jgi:TrmH family RNA methyltransferase
MLARVRIVLVRPLRSGNVGAVARAMANFGLSDLVLVAPACDPLDAQGTGFAARGKPVLAAARVVPSIADALQDCIASFATSAKGGLYRRQAGIAPAAAADAAMQKASSGPVAIAFGPEDRGLLQEELLHFDRVIEIPADPAYPALNLAAAATIVCYELRQAWCRTRDSAPMDSRQDVAPQGRTDILYAKLFDALERIGFFRTQQSPEHLRLALRRIFGRVELSTNEVDILIGMAQQIRWYYDHHLPTEGNADRHRGPIASRRRRTARED